MSVKTTATASGKSIGFVVGLVGFVVGGIPVAGNIIHAAILSYAVCMSGFVMGRLLGRNGHLLDRRR